MSTDRKKKKRGGLRIDRIKILEYGCIALVVLIFVGLAILYGGKKANGTPSPDTESTPSPVPTSDPSIRGKNVLDAIDGSGFTLTYQQDHYDLLCANGVSITLRMLSDDKGIRELSAETPLCADIDGDSEIAKTIRMQNEDTVEALHQLFDLIMPVFGRTAADSDTIVKQSQKVAQSGEAYSKRLGQFSLRIETDPESIPQSVTITLIRNP